MGRAAQSLFGVFVLALVGASAANAGPFEDAMAAYNSGDYTAAMRIFRPLADNGAKLLVQRGLVDTVRVVISGGSAGGYTTLASLAFRDFFQGGASYYGVSDAAALARDTHKLESRYLDWLIGPYPEEEARYRERSPAYHADRLSKPVIFFQGSEDAVVPPNQTEVMVEALRRNGNTVGYFLFDGEQHGFRQAANIKRCLDAELTFYAVEPPRLPRLPSRNCAACARQ